MDVAIFDITLDTVIVVMVNTGFMLQVSDTIQDATFMHACHIHTVCKYSCQSQKLTV